MVASVRQQYGLRIRSAEFAEMGWDEFSDLIGGLTDDTPLIRLAQLRTERDPERLKALTPEQRKVRNEWQVRRAKRRSAEEVANFIEQMQGGLAKMFGD